MFAFVRVDGHIVPCKMLYHLSLRLGDSTPPEICTVLQRLYSDDKIPPMPWELHAMDLGISMSYANRFHDIQVVPTMSIVSPMALAEFYSRKAKLDLWAAVSFDRSGLEADDDSPELDADDDDGEENT
ncbi:hypothetical protein BOTBODRAFT_198371 [Botryobasidium botryosum FD-172 SS1]|uniref:Uncharacterized protein n=1 Tax=Botryobasidium botryosum (strain FD-172 SS1) TaxID=930990 RepID=A0A067NB17_BOTB1|nr:hypothetical protein BOTBODRAFT_198371 [Botryobasidium botryosum FD-172 SS1]